VGKDITDLLAPSEREEVLPAGATRCCTTWLHDTVEST
jgi:hypothetical protein